MGLQTVGSWGLWTGFVVFVLVMVALDLGVFHRKAHAVGVKEAAIWSAVWVSLAAVFNLCVWVWFGNQRALEFTAGYLIEKALAVDNIFVFVVVFSAFRIPPKHQHRVLVWGIIGALLMRAVFILAGAAFIQRFSWAPYLFGALLTITGVKLFLDRNKDAQPGESRVVRFMRKHLPLCPDTDKGHFLVREGGKVMLTPLMLALISVELSDVVFALDSIPAIFAVTKDPFIVFTSNIFAILGLRAMYFLLAGVIQRFHHLKTGLAMVLVFVGAKMLLESVIHVPIVVSLGVIALILGVSIAASLIWPAAPAPVPVPPEPVDPRQRLQSSEG